MIGAWDNASPRYSFDGLIDEVGYWKRTLTPAERTTLYDFGRGLTYPFAVEAPPTLLPVSVFDTITVNTGGSSVTIFQFSRF